MERRRHQREAAKYTKKQTIYDRLEKE